MRCFTIAIPGPHAIQLLVHLPLGYPTADAPIAEVYESFGLTNAQRTQIIHDLVSLNLYTLLIYKLSHIDDIAL